MSASRIRVLCVDDHRIVREGIALIISRQPDMKVVGFAATGEDAVLQWRRHRPDITLMDLRLGETSGLDAIRAIRREAPDARVIVGMSLGGLTSAAPTAPAARASPPPRRGVPPPMTIPERPPVPASASPGQPASTAPSGGVPREAPCEIRHGVVPVQASVQVVTEQGAVPSAVPPAHAVGEERVLRIREGERVEAAHEPA